MFDSRLDLVAQIARRDHMYAYAGHTGIYDCKYPQQLDLRQNIDIRCSHGLQSDEALDTAAARKDLAYGV